MTDPEASEEKELSRSKGGIRVRQMIDAWLPLWLPCAMG